MIARFHEEADGSWGQYFDEEGLLFQGESRFQSIRIFQNTLFGKVLVLDGVVQTTERDEALYHEMLVHAPMCAVAQPRSVLIIGGGDGGTAREVLRHPVTQVTMVEIDGEVIAACREHLPNLSDGAFQDPRLELLVGDGITYVMGEGPPFDVIIVDSTDPDGPGGVLFTDEFYKACARRLGPGGIVVAQQGMPFLEQASFSAKQDRLGSAFPAHGAYRISVPTYTGGLMAIGWASADNGIANIDPDAIDSRLKDRNIKPKHYCGRRHRAAFMA